MKVHYRGFLSNHVTDSGLELLYLIYLSDLLWSRTMLTLRFSIIRWYKKYFKFICKKSTMNKEM